MATATEVVDWITLAAFTALGAVALRSWLARRDDASLWAALAFGALALIVLGGRALPDEETTQLELWLGRILIVFLVLFPYLLYRFKRTFSKARSPVDRAVVPLTLGLVLATLALPEFPESGEPRPVWFVAYLIAFLAHWALLSVLVAVRLWRAGSGQPSVARHRMRWLAGGSAALTVAIFFAAFGPEDESPASLVAGLGAPASAVGFLLGLAPPGWIRFAWRRPEQERFGEAVTRLMGATSEEDVASEVLPLIARLVGAHAAVLADEAGNVLARHGQAEPEPDGLIRLPFAGGSLSLWTSRYAPFFGDEEIRLVETLAALTGLALDRSRLFAQEREVREALERADELKTQFVALAAHELRAPVGNLHVTVDTLDRLRDRLSEEERRALEGLLRTQTERLRLLTEQLLDLSRLEAEAITLAPVPVLVRERVEEIVVGTVGGRAGEIAIQIDAALEAVIDLEAFDRVISNLVANAVRYGAPPVTVAAEQRDRHFRVTVEDHGPGVPSEFEPLLFERFARSARAAERSSGTGLGLSIARSYARAHGGDLVYHPVEPSGARFELVLPRRPAD